MINEKIIHDMIRYISEHPEVSVRELENIDQREEKEGKSE